MLRLGDDSWLAVTKTNMDRTQSCSPALSQTSLARDGQFGERGDMHALLVVMFSPTPTPPLFGTWYRHERAVIPFEMSTEVNQR